MWLRENDDIDEKERKIRYKDTKIRERRYKDTKIRKRGEKIWRKNS